VAACPHCRTEVPEGVRVCPGCHALLAGYATQAVGPGTTIELGYGRLVTDIKIGEGGMGIVWRAWLFYAPSSGRANEPPTPVALKMLHPRARAHGELRAFFVNEAEALKRVSHPNIVAFYGLLDQRSDLGIMMEYVDGETLTEVVARHVARARLAGPGALPGIPFQRAWYYFQQLLGALAATHALGIVHRDVKPANVLVRRDGIVKLGDFGIARAANPAGGPASAGLAPGTGAYMSPEQVLSQPLDGRSDLYSAAVVLYEMLAGRPPFRVEEKTEFLVRRDQVETPPPPLRQFLPQAPPVLDALFTRALAKEPGARFASAIELGTAFRAALGIPDSPAWQAQAELARDAATIPTADEPARTRRMATLRDFLVQKYRTEKITAR
jgi:serine/threonine-protein kinase